MINLLEARREGTYAWPVIVAESPSRLGRLLTLSNSYVAALELRIEKLERRLDYAKSRKASLGQHEADGTTHAILNEADRRDSLAVIRAAIHRKAARNRETSDVNALVSDFGILYSRPCLLSHRLISKLS